MKKRNRGKLKINSIPVLIAIILLMMSIGYSFFTETLKIGGSATANLVISGNALKLGFTPVDGRYSTGATPANFTFNSETLTNSNTITINYTRLSNSRSRYTFDLTLPFKNIYPVPLSSGTITSTILSGQGELSKPTVTLGSNTLAGKGTSQFNVNFSTTVKKSGTISLQVTVSYVVQGLTQYFYYIINIY
ncbi:MAG: hypothetical protein PHO63_00655 [Bacilli bacterium]|nr:hypothetical protein [Bacilli bacterium]MDD4809455.1 hypothetical protein [Bacilli bacterium]